jgi:hypothetical protein
MKNAWIFCFLLATAGSAARIAPLPAINTDQFPAFAETHIVPLIRSGVQGDWEFRSSFILNNTSNQTVSYSVEFYCEHGKPKDLTFVNNSGKSQLSRLSGQLAPHQILSYNANSKPDKMEELAWARVKSSVSGAITFETISWFMQPKGTERYFSMAPVPSDTRSGSFVFAGGEDLVLVNDNSAAQTVHLTARGEDGRELCRADKTVQPGQLLTDGFEKLLTCAQNQSGAIEVSAPNGIAMLALRYSNGIHPLYAGNAQGGLESSLEDRVKDIFDLILRPTRKQE